MSRQVVIALIEFIVKKTDLLLKNGKLENTNYDNVASTFKCSTSAGW